MKKHLIAAMGIACASVCSAGGANYNTPMNNFYAGIGLGATAGQVDLYDVSNGAITDAIMGQTKPNAQIFAGYKKEISDPFSLAIEAFYTQFSFYNGNAYTFSYNNGTPNSYIVLTTENYYGAKLMPTAKLTDTADAFISVGVAWSKYKYYTSPGLRASGANSLYSKTLTGLLLGAGSEIAVSPKVSLRGEYQFVEYETWREAPLANVNTQDKTKTSTVIASIVYRCA
jgi:opacity protein-like surface antigen